MKSYLNKVGISRGLRNNNPGNLIKTDIPWEGKVPHSESKDARFEQFIELRYGIRAKMRDVLNDIGKGKNTIEKLINEFAPTFENNTAAYIANVALVLGILPKTPITSISEEFLIALCKAISRVENGKAMDGYVTDADYQDAIQILGPTAMPVQKKKTTRS